MKVPCPWCGTTAEVSPTFFNQAHITNCEGCDKSFGFLVSTKVEYIIETAKVEMAVVPKADL